MKNFEELSAAFSDYFNTRHFPERPQSLYEPAEYFLSMGGKRIRPVMCLMGNELFDEIGADAYQAAIAIELFHNFTLIHDDIMDKAPLRRGKQTVHEKYSQPTALLAGDVMLVVAYNYLNTINSIHLRRIVQLFNKTAMQVCEGQQIDMDFENRASVSMKEYLGMIELKTSVLLAASLQMGAILGGAGEGNQQHLYQFGLNIGLAFQVQDDFLDAFGDPARFGKKVGGDILANKKTFLMVKAREQATDAQAKELDQLGNKDGDEKIERTLAIFKDYGVDSWAKDLKQTYLNKALEHLDDIAVLTSRKKSLEQLAGFLIKRDY